MPYLFWEYYGNAKEIFIVRDFRDVVASMLAFNAKRGSQGFGRARASSDAEFIRLIATTQLQALCESWKARCDKAILIKYEDLCLAPEQQLYRLLDYLGLEKDAQTIRTMHMADGEAQKTIDLHGTSASASASIGKWETYFPDYMKNVCNEAFSEANRVFGYV